MPTSLTTPNIDIDAVKAVVALDSAGWRGRSLLTMADVGRDRVEAALYVAGVLKSLHRSLGLGSSAEPLWTYPRTLAMLFEKPSLRTRVSFEAGMAQLGGHAIYLAPTDIGLDTREPVEDVAAALSRWVDVVSARVFSHAMVERLASAATVPVINALSEVEHPCQAFADLLTIRERKGEFVGLKLAYVGDGNNVLHSLMLACASVGIHVTAACPEGYGPNSAIVGNTRAIGAESGATLMVYDDPCAAVANADVLYTDVWASMGQEEERERRVAAFQGYCIDERLLRYAKPDAIVLHCLPAHRGEEVSEGVMEQFHEVILDQAENRLHTQKALIALIVGA